MCAFTGKEDGTPRSSTWQRTLKQGFDRRFGPAEPAASLRLNCPYSAPVPKTLAVFIFILAKHLSRRRNQQVNPSTDNAHDGFIGAIRGFFRRLALHTQASFGAAIREGDIMGITQLGSRGCTQVGRRKLRSVTQTQCLSGTCRRRNSGMLRSSSISHGGSSLCRIPKAAGSTSGSEAGPCVANSVASGVQARKKRSRLFWLLNCAP
jgi:hypothetical protein